MADDGGFRAHDLGPDLVQDVTAAVVVAVAAGAVEVGHGHAMLAEGVHDPLGVLKGDAVDLGEVGGEGDLRLGGEGFDFIGNVHGFVASFFM